MTFKTILYIIIVPITIWSFESINISNIFKKNRYYQSRVLYLLFVLGLSYLVVNFLLDFFPISNTIK